MLRTKLSYERWEFMEGILMLKNKILDISYLYDICVLKRYIIMIWQMILEKYILKYTHYNCELLHEVH